MKCIQCGTDNNLKDRTSNQGRCSKCQHPFAFEPTSMGTVKVTDPMFAKSLTDLSANNTLFFTPKQLQYFLDRRLRSKPPISKAVWIVIYLAFGGFIVATFGNVLFQMFQTRAAFLVVLAVVNAIVINSMVRSSQSNKLNSQQRKASVESLKTIGIIILAIAVFGGILADSFLGFAINIMLGMLALYLSAVHRNRQSTIYQAFLVESAQVNDWLARWSQVNGAIDKLLPSPRVQTTPASVNPDISAYSFDRLVVCDKADIAQFLISNNFHFENNCAVLSITGYPQSIFATTMEMLRRNPDLQVYAFHDCTPSGFTLAHRLRTSPQWFQTSNVAIVDIGLSPRQILAAETMFVQQSAEFVQAAKQLPAEVRQALSATELDWLEAGNFVELESFPPQRLLQILHQGIAGSRDLEGDDGGLILIGDTGSSYYAVDSFG